MKKIESVQTLRASRGRFALSFELKDENGSSESQRTIFLVQGQQVRRLGDQWSVPSSRSRKETGVVGTSQLVWGIRLEDKSWEVGARARPFLLVGLWLLVITTLGQCEFRSWANMPLQGEGCNRESLEKVRPESSRQRNHIYSGKKTYLTKQYFAFILTFLDSFRYPKRAYQGSGSVQIHLSTVTVSQNFPC